MTERIAILAGGGLLPVAIARSITARGGSVHLVALGDGHDAATVEFPVTRVPWGKVGALIEALRRNGDAIVIAGKVSRPDLTRITPDFGFFRAIPDVLSMLRGGDDAILTRVVRFFERKGFVVKGVGDVAPELIAPEGLVAGPEAASAIAGDVRAGRDVLDAIAALDIGQAIVVADGRVLAIEGVEGTDRMLERLVPIAGSERRGVLVKMPKRGQELRIDLPTIGATTIENVARAGLAAVAVRAGRSVVLERDAIAALAADQAVSVLGIGDEQEARAAAVPPAAFWDGRTFGRITPTDADRADGARAAEAVTALEPYDTGSAAVVVRQHVLAVAASEGPLQMAERIKGLRQWGRMARRRSGALAVRAEEVKSDPALLPKLVVSAATASLAGVVIVADADAARDFDANAEARALADARGLFLIAVTRYASDHSGSD